MGQNIKLIQQQYYKKIRKQRGRRKRKQRGGIIFGGIGNFSRSLPFSTPFKLARGFSELSKRKGFVNKAKYLFKNIKLIKYV